MIVVLSRHLSVETEESHDDSQCSDRNSNQGSPKCKSGAILSRQLVRCIGNIAAVGYTEFIAVFFCTTKFVSFNQVVFNAHFVLSLAEILFRASC